MNVAATLIPMLLAPRLAVGMDCPRGTTLGDVTITMDTMERSLADVRIDAFLEEGLNLEASISCLVEILPPSVAARAHRLDAYEAYLLRDFPRVAQEFAASRRAAPDQEIPSVLFGEDHDIRVYFAQLDLPSATFETVPKPNGGRLLVDGRPSEQRPSEWPVYVQWLREDLSVEWTVRVRPGEAWPSYEEDKPLHEGVQPPSGESPVRTTPLDLGPHAGESQGWKDALREHPVRAGLLATTGATGAAAAVLGGVAGTRFLLYDYRSVTDITWTQVKRPAAAALVLGVAAATSGTATAVFWRF